MSWLVLILMACLPFTPEQAHLIMTKGSPDVKAKLHALLSRDYYTFKPRPNRPAELDQQEAFLLDNTSKFAVLLGGNGSGKTICAAHKTARYVMQTPPMRPRLPFWIIGEILGQVCEVCWNEKLSNIIPPELIMPGGISWYRRQRNWPESIMLKHPTIPGEVGWILEFRSYQQGVGSLKGASIGGYWFNEEVPFQQAREVRMRCRDYDSPGWADFTPVECKGDEWPDAFRSPPPGWRFYRLNSLLNTALPPGFHEREMKGVPEDEREMRTTGAFMSYRGAVFKEWNKDAHVCQPFEIPHDWFRVRGIDFGYNNPFCCLWVARDHDDNYYVYDEHYAARQGLDYHAKCIGRRLWDKSLPYFGATYADHDPQDAAELHRMGVETIPANKGDASLRASISLIREMLLVPEGRRKPRIQVFDTCENLIEEMPKYHWGEGTSGRDPADVPIDVDNHAISAMRYAIYSDYISRMGRKSLASGWRSQIDGAKWGVHGVRARR